MCKFILIIFICTKAPVLLLTMINVALYVYAQPHQKLYVNLLEAVMLVDILLLLIIISTKVRTSELMQAC